MSLDLALPLERLGTETPRAGEFEKGSGAPLRPLVAPAASPERSAAWRSTYVRRLVLVDIACAVVAAALGLVVKFGLEPSSPHVQRAAFWVAVALPVVWPLAMVLARTYEQRFLWAGAEEFCRVFWAFLVLIAAVGTVSWALKLEVARGFVIVTLPLLVLLTLLSRFAQRRWLRHQRSRGRSALRVVIVGQAAGVQSLQRQIERLGNRGYQVVGCCVPDEADRVLIETGGSLAVLGGLTEVADVVRRHEVDMVAALPSEHLSGDDLRRLGWDLEATTADLLLVPALTEVAGPRVRIRPALGMPILQVDRLDVTGARNAMKEALDRCLAAVALLVFSPALVVISLIIKCTSRGPVFFRHERIGRNGRTFRMLKFRSMYQGADRQFDALLDQSEGNAVQFKMRRDPRVTPIGSFLRRFSLDELPQLFNVLGGSMSLVGPRPHVTREVEQYDRDMQRRLVVKPGMTGLWQVSGRSDLSWSDSVRIDVRYVENWSLALDLMILGKTVRAVVKGSGAY
jgi:exopolysaccharide biosynthesis polyprenyl glycosylphosphotransferase